MKKREIKVGDKVTPKRYPELNSIVDRIETFMGEKVYVLKNNTRYIKEELK
jgi:hypothetical protein